MLIGRHSFCFGDECFLSKRLFQSFQSSTVPLSLIDTPDTPTSQSMSDEVDWGDALCYDVWREIVESPILSPADVLALAQTSKTLKEYVFGSESEQGSRDVLIAVKLSWPEVLRGGFWNAARIKLKKEKVDAQVFKKAMRWRSQKGLKSKDGENFLQALVMRYPSLVAWVLLWVVLGDIPNMVAPLLSAIQDTDEDVIAMTDVLGKIDKFQTLNGAFEGKTALLDFVNLMIETPRYHHLITPDWVFQMPVIVFNLALERELLYPDMMVPNSRTRFRGPNIHILTALRGRPDAGKKMQALVEVGQDPNVSIYNNMSLLLWAAVHDFHFTVEDALTLPGIDVNVQDIDGRTPLIKSARCFPRRAMRVLLEDDRVDVNAQDAEGDTALHVMLGSNGAILVDELRAFLRRPEIDLEILNNLGESAFDLAAELAYRGPYSRTLLAGVVGTSWTNLFRPDPVYDSFRLAFLSGMPPNSSTLDNLE